MKKNYLFPRRFEMIGWILFGIAVIFTVWNLLFNNSEFKISVPAIIYSKDLFDTAYFGFTKCDIMTFVYILATIGLIFAGFSKTKEEDECVVAIREQSLIWATYASAIFYIIITLTIYGWAFMYFQYSLFFVFLLFFIIKFKIELNRLKKDSDNESN